MPLACTFAVALAGVDGRVVQVQADLSDGLPAFTLTGLPDTALTEARDRVRAAIVNSGESWPARRITVNLSPADLPKSGTAFDLAIAVAVVGSADRLPVQRLDGLVLLGELGLSGRVQPVRGVLPAVLAARSAGLTSVVVPEANAAEAALVAGMSVLGARSLRQVLAVLREEDPPDEPVGAEPGVGAGGRALPDRLVGLDLAEVLGQPEARRAVEVAAAGGHHALLVGPPGAGKTMLAERLPGLLPDLPVDDALQVSAIHSVAGTLPAGAPLLVRPPYCDPHHTATLAAVVGGGSRAARPGAVSLAHRGVLFLDEAPEFRPSVLEALRQPLESGEVVIARAAGIARFPAAFQLVLAANPCPCGNSVGKGLDCTCTSQARLRYRQRLSGPVHDRIDIVCQVSPVAQAELVADGGSAESTAVVAARVAAARDRQRRRLAGTPWRHNGQVPGPELRRRYRPQPGSLRLVDRHLALGRLTARGVDRVLRVAWTLADLAGRDRPGADDVNGSLALRLGQLAATTAIGRRTG